MKMIKVYTVWLIKENNMVAVSPVFFSKQEAQEWKKTNRKEYSKQGKLGIGVSTQSE